MFRKILVPLDGSKLGESALPQVEDLAALKAEVILFHTVSAPHDVQLAESYLSQLSHLKDEYIKHTSTAAIDYLNVVKERLAKKGMVAQVRVEIGHPADRIIDYARQNGVDLIAMSTHSRSGAGRWLFGSIADKVVRATEKPVLLIRPRIT